MAGGGIDRLDFALITSTSIVVTANLTSDTALATHTNRTIQTAAAGQAANFENVTGGAGPDKLTGNALGNLLDGGIGNDLLTGGAGPDSLVGGAGSDSMLGGSGDNVYVFAAAAAAETDTLTELPGEGADRLDFSALPTTVAVTVDLNSDAALAKHTNRTVKTAVVGQAVNFEHATGGAGNDSLTGNAASNRLEGGAGNDTLRAGAGDNSLLGGAGNDTYVFVNPTSNENNVLTELPNEGTDLLDLSALTVNVNVNLTSDDFLVNQLNRIVRTAAAGQAEFLESVKTGSGSDFIAGNANPNRLEGGTGNDTIFGRDGNDTIDGGAGNDVLLGDAGADSITGGLDNDAISGGNDNDVLNGNEGNDSIVGGTGADSLLGGAGTGIDLLIGDDGDDTLAGEGGQDSLNGGAGTNTLVNTTNGTTNTLDDDIIGVFIFNIDELLGLS